MLSRCLIDPVWRERYKEQLVSRETALSWIPRGARIFVGSACGEPQFLVEGLTELSPNMIDTEILHILTLGVAPYTAERFSSKFRHNAFFIAENTREAVAQGRADYTPVLLSELPGLFKSRRVRLDAALIQVSPPDRHGYVSLGVSVDVTLAALKCSRLVIAEVNENVPRTMGYSFVHVSELDALVEHDAPLIVYKPPEPDERSLRLAKIIAKLVDDGSTIQIGIGAIPSAVVPALTEKNDLGVHTEMFSQWLCHLVEKGVVTNKRKTLNPGKSVASFVMGDQALYEWIDMNPMVSLHPSEYVNDPFIISQNEKMVAINTALEIDLTGQVCSDSIGHRFYSGIGGQVDFINGASRSKEGKAIIALMSTVKENTISTIVPVLSEGAGVVTTRGSVRYVVTEWGYADLYGKSIRERAMALIAIAHPKFRDWLLEEAKRLRYVYTDQISPPPGGYIYPDELECAEEICGKNLFFRPIKPADEGMLKELFYSLTDESVYRRYFSKLKMMPHHKLQEETNLDYLNRMGIIAVTTTDGAEEMAGLGQYTVDPSNDEAELSFIVRDDWQGKGLGGELLRIITKIARSKRVKALTAFVLRDNHAMLHLFLKNGFVTRYVPGEDAFFVRLPLAEE